MRGKYDDMLNLPRPVSPNRPHMTRVQRAAQFAPFAALTGYEAAVQEAGRLTEQRRNLDEEQKAILNEKLHLAAKTKMPMAFTWFVQDTRKAGGAYVTHMGVIRHLDPAAGMLYLADGVVIPIQELEAIFPPEETGRER